MKDILLGTYKFGDITVVKKEVTIDSRTKERSIVFESAVDGMSTHYWDSTLDRAMVRALAVKYDGHNTQAAKFFYLMVGMGETE